jgi:electron transfer flavoprotein alpha subunit
MVLVFAEKDGSTFKKSSFEALSYGRDLADQMGTTCGALVIGKSSDDELAKLSNHGAQAIYSHEGSGTDQFDPEVYTAALKELWEAAGGKICIVSGSYTGKILAPKIAVATKSSLATGVVEMAHSENGFRVKKTCFSNKAFAEVELKNETKVIGIIPNSYTTKTYDGSATSQVISTDLSSKKRTASISVDKVAGKVPLTEAEIVVSGGRGLKGPENWGMMEELASLLGAATACSKPVSDMDWRPHSEHVGQTGITIKPNLYIAVGISGAIQHLAGVGGSKVICVVNTDAEAPFFKAADYGIVGDAFEVVPRLIQRLKEIKA